MSVSRVSNATAATAVAGLHMVTPTSVTVGSGTGSVSSQGSVTFSGASSVSLNGCFSPVYDNYRINIYLSSVSTVTYPYLRFRDSGGDVSVSNYMYRSSSYNSSSTGSDTQAFSRTQTAAYIIAGGSGEMMIYSLDIYSPNLVAKTLGAGAGTVQVGNHETTGFSYAATTQFTGVSLISSAGTFAGNIRVYGYNNGGA